ncbi:alpha,alpha-trehalase TreF [Sphingomonas sp. RIT328]|uniref:alpha,alpha-trehalase TreF n=1 Tax=Sphingomonas sp. RIT328 TaxID=1470591 RepID=UPI000451991A|nr:alpha,alpha-trehalase TreF [Sphingomonas sp. RIT328]EZP49997.1 Alpha,alpha-trehalase [Sphingomonas sp. RIT328]
MSKILYAVAALALAATPIHGAEPSPATLYGPLFAAVQTQHVFADGKTFADAVPKRAAAAILADYNRLKPDGAALRAFVLANFVVRGENDRGDLREHVRNLWPQLVRQPFERQPGSSALSLAKPYVVPGGRFQEIYYWDSYFTMLGLKADGQQPLVEAMIDNFTDLIERYGHIPNGTRTYYLGRSQPPYYALMLDLSEVADPAVQARRLRALRSEYAYWMRGRGCVATAAACLRVVRMPDGSELNRYYDDNDTPRDESFAEDLAVATKAQGRPAAAIYRDLRAGAESGWDFSSRWLRDPQSLGTIHTTDIVPIDLNSLIWAMERRIAQRCAQADDAGCSRDFTGRAVRRKTAIDRYLWQQAQSRYADWDLSTRQPTAVLSAATLQPLFVGLASPTQAAGVAETTQSALLAEGGLRTTTVRTPLQWDEPNGWAPLQWVAIDGLARAGHETLAREIASRWIGTVGAAYADTGKMLEKYNVERRTPGGGGEYPVQDGFGWTNGVTSAILERWPDLAKANRPA